LKAQHGIVLHAVEGLAGIIQLKHDDIGDGEIIINIDVRNFFGNMYSSSPMQSGTKPAATLIRRPTSDATHSRYMATGYASRFWSMGGVRRGGIGWARKMVEEQAGELWGNLCDMIFFRALFFTNKNRLFCNPKLILTVCTHVIVFSSFVN
jgi:hypothetical protein